MWGDGGRVSLTTFDREGVGVGGSGRPRLVLDCPISFLPFLIVDGKSGPSDPRVKVPEGCLFKSIVRSGRIDRCLWRNGDPKVLIAG